jgi:hypothetical protein
MLHTRDAGMPTTWDCVDCGTNTAPGMPTCSQLDAIFNNPLLNGSAKTFQCVYNDQTEVYRVTKRIWRKACMSDFSGCLCIGCLEKRIRRRLVPTDFEREHALNDPHLPCTERLRSRRTRRH